MATLEHSRREKETKAHNVELVRRNAGAARRMGRVVIDIIEDGSQDFPS
jgi:hypothetical protein